MRLQTITECVQLTNKVDDDVGDQVSGPSFFTIFWMGWNTDNFFKMLSYFWCKMCICLREEYVDAAGWSSSILSSSSSTILKWNLFKLWDRQMNCICVVHSSVLLRLISFFVVGDLLKKECINLDLQLRLTWGLRNTRYFLFNRCWYTK